MTISRYQNNLTTTARPFDSASVYQTALPKDVPTLVTDPVVTLSVAQRLDNLAFQYYGDPLLWWVIAQANGIVNGTLHVPAGAQLTIPSIDRVQ